MICYFNPRYTRKINFNITFVHLRVLTQYTRYAQPSWPNISVHFTNCTSSLGDTVAPPPRLMMVKKSCMVTSGHFNSSEPTSMSVFFSAPGELLSHGMYQWPTVDSGSLIFRKNWAIWHRRNGSIKASRTTTEMSDPE